MKKFMVALLVVTMSVCVMLPVVVSAAETNPSVELKPAPTVVKDESGNVAAIYNNSENKIYDVSQGSLIITPISSASKAEDAEMAEKLNKAYNEILSSDSIGDVCDNITEVLTKMGVNVAEKDLAVLDVLVVSVYGEAYENLVQDGNYINMTFDLNLKPKDLLIVLHYGENGWEAIDPSNVTKNDDGSVTVRFYNLSPIAFVVKSSDSGDGEVISPDTYDSNVVNWIAVCAVSGIISAAAFVLYASSGKSRSK